MAETGDGDGNQLHADDDDDDDMGAAVARRQAQATAKKDVVVLSAFDAKGRAVASLLPSGSAAKAAAIKAKDTDMLGALPSFPPSSVHACISWPITARSPWLTLFV